MPAAALAQPLGISTPLTSAQLPISLYVNYTDLVRYVDKSSYRLEAPGNTPARFVFTLTDQNNRVGLNVLSGQRVMWVDNVNSRVLFQGHIRYIRPTVRGPWAEWEIECFDLSEILDRTVIVSEIRPAETDQARIDYFVTKAGFPINVAGVTSNGTIQATTASKETLRASIERALTAAAINADYGVDNFGALSTWVGNPATTAPYAITDNNPSNTVNGATISAVVAPEYDDSLAADAVQVYGATAAGSGLFYGSAAPGWPLRVVSVDAPDCYDATTAQAVANAEIASRTTLQRATITVTGFDGWARGQTVTVTNSVLGWSGKQLVIQGVNMTVLSGTSIRRYELVCGSPMPSMSKDLAASIAVARGANPGAKTVGQLGQGPGGMFVNQTPSGTGISGVSIMSTDGSTVIVDGTSGVFRIAATGTTSATAAGNGAVTFQQVTLTGLGALASTPAHLSFVTDTNATSGGQAIGTLMQTGDGFVAGSSGGAVTVPVITISWINKLTTFLNGSSQCVFQHELHNGDTISHTQYSRYYILVQVAL